MSQHWTNKELDVEIPRLAQFKFVHLPKSDHNVTLNVIEGGEQNEPLLILLHGFPETALLTWGPLIDQFILEGYHVIAPDMRGFNTSSKPVGLAAYESSIVATDIKQLITDYAKKEKAIVIGVDWGGAIAWEFSQLYPNHLLKLVNSVPMLNALPPAALWKHKRQFLKSWYMFFFQLQGIAEYAVARNHYAMLLRSYDELGRKGLFSEKIAQRYISAWSQPYELTATLNYYRNLILNMLKTMLHLQEKKPVQKLKVPALLIYPSRDKYIEQGLVLETFNVLIDEKVKSQSQFLTIESSHWITQEKPQELFSRVIQFLKSTNHK
jgi:pimeloyl-ACP methyl ester carboxylesterase